jgi:hypothetical protein
MRLIDIKNLTNRNFFHDAPPYAILSHTWQDDEEVTFKGIERGKGQARQVL